MIQPRRAMSLAELDEIGKPLITAEGYKAGMQIQLRPTDVVITPYGKSGTTWTQQIVHTLRTRGDMDFDDISRVVPWIETSTDLGIDLNAEQKANPRAFKSHLDYEQIPKGGRYINVMREPGDVAVSGFKFQEGWFLEPGSVSIDEYVLDGFVHKRNYFKHLKSWWAQRNQPDVLFLCYETMLSEPAETIRRIAQFIEIELDPELLQIALDHTSIDFMLAHKDRFDDALLRARSEAVCNIPPGSDSAKVRAGKSGSSHELSDESRTAIAQAWQEEISAPLGFTDYAAMQNALANE
ncbi:MAG: sulfotransferase domain-containing protein [Pseudomonadota bacterium]